MLETVATELPRLLACNGSRLLGGSLPPSNDDPTARNEGTAAHWLIATCFRGGDDPKSLVGAKAPNGVIITNNIVASVVDYLDFIRKRGGYIEQDSMLVGAGWSVACRPDHWVTTDEGFTLEINDFKHGFRIVEPENNWTMIAYACAIAQAYDCIPQVVVFRVHQPRVMHPLGSVRETRLTGAELHNRWLTIDRTLSNLNDQLNTGPHCGKCPSLLSCGAARTAGFNAVDVSMTAHAENLTDDQIAAELPILEAAESRLKERRKQLENLAIFRLKQGAIIDGYGVERSYGQKVFKSDFTGPFLSAMLGVDVTKPDVITPNQAIKAGASAALVDTFSDRKESGLKLTRVAAHKRAERMFGRK